MMADQGQEHASVWTMADLVTPMAVRVAATLRLADAIARGIQTAPELAEAAQVDPDALARVMHHLVTADVLTVDRSGRYVLTALGDELRDDHPSGLRARLDLDGAVGRADLSLVQLLHSVRTGEAAFPVQFGRPFWDDLAADRACAASYDAQMGADIAADAPTIASAFDWGSLGTIVDVGGGNGALLAAILRAYPSLRGTVFDQPATAAAARTMLASAGVADRSDVVSGSFFDRLPSGAGGYILSAVLHDWNDDPARAILSRCAAAAGKQGTVLIIEKFGADGQTVRTDMDLRMLAYFGGRERTVAGLIALAATVGCAVVGVHPAGALAIVELTTASRREDEHDT